MEYNNRLNEKKQNLADFQSAIIPIVYLNSICGIEIWHIPYKKPRLLFTIFYILLCWGVFAVMLVYYTWTQITFQVDEVQRIICIFVVLFYLNIVVSVCLFVTFWIMYRVCDRTFYIIAYNIKISK